MSDDRVEAVMLRWCEAMGYDERMAAEVLRICRDESSAEPPRPKVEDA